METFCVRACVCVLCSRFSWRYRFLLYWCRYSYKNAIEFWQRREETISPVKKISGYKIVWDSEGRMRRWRALDGNQLQRGRGLERNKANRVTSEPNWNTDHRDDVERRDDNNSAHDVHKQEERARKRKGNDVWFTRLPSPLLLLQTEITKYMEASQF